MSALVVLASVSALRFITTTVASCALDLQTSERSLSPWCQQKKLYEVLRRSDTSIPHEHQFPIYLDIFGIRGRSSPDNLALPKVEKKMKKLEDQGMTCQIFGLRFWKTSSLRFIRWWYQLLFQSFYLVDWTQTWDRIDRHVKLGKKNIMFKDWLMDRYHSCWNIRWHEYVRYQCVFHQHALSFWSHFVSKRNSPRQNTGLIKDESRIL